MKYRRFGKTHLKVSVIGMGTWQLGGEWGKTFAQGEVDAMFAQARQAGINLIDTAECYGHHLAETMIGAAIHRDRDQWVLATKFGHIFHSHMKRSDARSPRDAVEQFEASLRALRTDHVDLLQYHSVRDAEFDNDELTTALLKLVKSGKVRHLGNSISNNDNIHQADQSTVRHVEAVQVIYNRLDRQPEDRVFASCIRQDLGVLARVPLASGFLSGRYQPGVTFGPDDVRAGRDRQSIDCRLHQAQEIAAKEVPPGVPMAQWALAWCLQHPAVSAVIPGCKNVEQVESNARAADLDLVRTDHRQAWHTA